MVTSTSLGALALDGSSDLSRAGIIKLLEMVANGVGSTATLSVASLSAVSWFSK